MNKVTLKTPTQVVVRPELKETITSFEIDRLMDLPREKKVIAFCRGLSEGPITVFSDAEYDTVGQWTDTDVLEKLSELFGFTVESTE